MKKITQILRQNQGTSLIQILLVMVVMITVLIMSGIFNPPRSPVTDKTEHEVSTGPSIKKSALSIVELPMNSVSPIPTPAEDVTPTVNPLLCNAPNEYTPVTNLPCVCTADFLVECKAGKCVKMLQENLVGGTGHSCDDMIKIIGLNLCAMPNFANGKDGTFCMGKPVIYLYPEKDTLVNVAIETEGKVVVSDPLIETTNGWHDVLAHPDGTLVYKNKKYRELFYETESTTLKRPEKGIVMNKKSLRSDLLKFITQLGLTRQDEQEEFLDWWLPRLAQIRTDKIFVSILEKDEKNRLDKIAIEPKPDTMIEFIAYFAPLADNETVSQLVLPAQLKRIGFTAVEWGGVIGK